MGHEVTWLHDVDKYPLTDAAHGSTDSDLLFAGQCACSNGRARQVASVWADRHPRKWSDAEQVVDIESAGWRASACQREAEDCTRTVWNDMHIMVWGTPGDVQP